MSKSTEKLSVGLQMGIYMIGITVYGAAAVTPALGALQAKYAEAPAFVVTMLSTLPSLFVILGALLVGAVVGKKIKFKTIAIIALAVYGAAGVAPVFFAPSLEVTLVWRAISGFGNGLMFPLGAAAILRYVQDPDLRSTYLGRNQALGSGGAILLTILGGYMASIDAMYTFWVYGLSFVALVIMLFTFKEPPTLDEIIARNPDYQAEGGNARRVKLAPLCWGFLVLFLLYQLFQGPSLMTMAPRMTMAADGVDQSAAAGLVMSLFTLSSFMIAGFTDKLIKIFGRFTASFFWAVGAIGIFIIFLGGSNIMFGVGVFLLGLGIGVAVMCQFECSLISSPAAMAWIASLSMIATNLGNFLGSYWYGLLDAVFAGDMNMMVLTGAIGFALCGIIWAVVDFRNPAWKTGKPVRLSQGKDAEAGE